MATVPDVNDNSARPLAIDDIAVCMNSDLKLQDDGVNELKKQVMKVTYNSELPVPSIKGSSKILPTPPVIKTFASESSFDDESFKLEETLIASISVHSHVNHGMNQRASIKSKVAHR